MRYNWVIPDIPKFCACGEKNDINHCLTCKTGGYVIMRHNRIRDTEASIMKEVCFDVQPEPMLTPLVPGEVMTRSTNTADQARLDISGRGVWCPSDRAFFDIRVSHPNTLSNRNLTLEQVYTKNEEEKKRSYNDRVINVERGTFTPLVFLTSGGMSKECKKLNDKLAEKIARKRGERYADVVKCIRTKLRFAMLKSTLVALRGYRGNRAAKESYISDISFNLILEANIVE